MAYMRDDYYIYPTGDDLTIFAPNVQLELPMEVFDDLVAMRWAQLDQTQRTAIQERAILRYGGNLGCIALCRELGYATFMDSWLRGGQEDNNG